VATRDDEQGTDRPDLLRSHRVVLSARNPLIRSVQMARALGPFPTITLVNKLYCEAVKGRPILKWGEFGDRGDYLNALEKLANAAVDEGRVDELVAVYEKLYSDTVEILGPDHFWAGEALENVAHGLHYLGR
jgi:hypothetical protein